MVTQLNVPDKGVVYSEDAPEMLFERLQVVREQLYNLSRFLASTDHKKIEDIIYILPVNRL